MSTQATFLKQFEALSNFKLVGNALFMKTDTLTAKITLSTSGTYKTWTGFTVKTVGKNQQVLDTQTFKFKDFLEKEEGSRVHDSFCVIENCGWVWYIMTPTQESIKCLTGTIEEHISMYL